jgi:hypothetical protein
MKIRNKKYSGRSAAIAISRQYVRVNNKEKKMLQQKNTARETYLQFLKKIADKRDYQLCSPGQVAHAKRWLKYVSKPPTNFVEAEVHRLFLLLCEGEDSAVRCELDFWTEVLSNQLKTHVIVGQEFLTSDQLPKYRKIIYKDHIFSIHSCAFERHVKEFFGAEIKQFLFRAEKVYSLDRITKKVYGNPEGIHTLITLLAGEDSLVLLYHPAITLAEAASFLRDKLSTLM